MTLTKTDRKVLLIIIPICFVIAMAAAIALGAFISMVTN